MTRAIRSAASILLGTLVLAGCASESGFRPWTGDPDDDSSADGDGDGDGDNGNDGPGTGGWGDWEPSAIPDIAIVLGTYNEASWIGEVVVADLRGRILDTWTPPPNEITQVPGQIMDIQPVRAGEVLVTVSADGFWSGGDGGWEKTTTGNTIPLRGWLGATEVWHGDLVSREWTRMVHMDVTTGRYIVDGTGQTLPIQAWGTAWGLQAAPWQGSDHHVMLSWHEGMCEPGDAQRVLVVSTNGEDVDQERFWTLDRDWELGFNPLFQNLQSGMRADGQAFVLAQVSTMGCTNSQLPVATHLVRWRVDGVPEVLDAEDTTGNPPRLHAPSSTALRLSMPTQERGWIMHWAGMDGAIGATFEHDSTVRLVAPLDPEHGAALLALHDKSTATDELVLVADGRDVWRIDELKEGLGTRPIRYSAGAVVMVPGE